MIREHATPSMIADYMEEVLRLAEFEYGFAADDIATRWQLSVDNKTRAQMRRALHASLGVDVQAFVDDPIVADALTVGSREAASLIKSIPRDYLRDVAKAVADGFLGSGFPEGRNLIQQIQHIGGVNRRRARLIARDQTNKLIGHLDRSRQMSIGIETYVWRTVRDQRVVGNPVGRSPTGSRLHGNHYKMDGMLCRWDDSDVYSRDGGKTWIERDSNMKGAIPGSQIQCRCWSAPVIDIDRIMSHVRTA